MIGAFQRATGDTREAFFAAAQRAKFSAISHDELGAMSRNKR